MDIPGIYMDIPKSKSCPRAGFPDVSVTVPCPASPLPGFPSQQRQAPWPGLPSPQRRRWRGVAPGQAACLGLYDSH